MYKQEITHLESDNDSDLDSLDSIEMLDESWLLEFEETEKKFKKYYKQDVSELLVYCYFINDQRSIHNHIKEKITFKTPGILTKEELLYLINQYKSKDDMLVSILKINIDINPQNIQSFLKSTNDNVSLGSSFIQSINKIDDIAYIPTIEMFHDLNNLILIFGKKNLTKAKLRSITKRILGQGHHSKTKRK